MLQIAAGATGNPNFPSVPLFFHSPHNPINSEVMEEKKHAICQNDRAYYMIWGMNSSRDCYGWTLICTFNWISFLTCFIEISLWTCVGHVHAWVISGSSPTWFDEYEKRTIKSLWLFIFKTCITQKLHYKLVAQSQTLLWSMKFPKSTFVLKEGIPFFKINVV